MSNKSRSAKGSKKAGAKKAGAKKGTARRSPRGAMAIASSASRGVKERVASIREIPLASRPDDENLPKLLAMLGDDNEPAEVRLAALKAMQKASFRVVSFATAQGDYTAILRKLTADPNQELRERALAILARRKDGHAQKKLLEGLQDPGKALLAPEKALQLLSYDAHAEAYDAARGIVSQPPSEGAKREALRLLAADPKSAPMFEKLLRDKSETAEIRQLSATALHAINPEKLQKHARELLFDTSEQEDIQASSLTALTNFGDAESVANDEPLLERVDSLRQGASAKVKQSARRFLSKYSR